MQEPNEPARARPVHIRFTVAFSLLRGVVANVQTAAPASGASPTKSSLPHCHPTPAAGWRERRGDCDNSGRRHACRKAVIGGHADVVCPGRTRAGPREGARRCIERGPGRNAGCRIGQRIAIDVGTGGCEARRLVCRYVAVRLRAMLTVGAVLARTVIATGSAALLTVPSLARISML